jgi:formyltetrahydrofolate synthetase
MSPSRISCRAIILAVSLPEHPAAESIDVDDAGRITGLF